MPNKSKYLMYFAVLSIISAQCACAAPSDPLAGMVIDKTTGEPVEGAIVVAQWQGAAFHLVDSRTVCFHVESATTDEGGRYNIAAIPAAPAGVMSESALVAGVYKEGYREVTYKDTQEPGFVRAPRDVVHLIPFTGSREERFEYLHRTISRISCTEAGKSERSLLLPYTKIYEEAKSLAVTKEERRDVVRFRRIAASAAVAVEGNMPSTEWNRIVDDYLKDHLK